MLLLGLSISKATLGFSVLVSVLLCESCWDHWPKGAPWVRKPAKQWGPTFWTPLVVEVLGSDGSEGRQALELRGLGSDPDYVTLGQLQSLSVPPWALSLEKGDTIAFLGRVDEVVHVRYLTPSAWYFSSITTCLLIRALRLGLNAGGVVYVRIPSAGTEVGAQWMVEWMYGLSECMSELRYELQFACTADSVKTIEFYSRSSGNVFNQGPLGSQWWSWNTKWGLLVHLTFSFLKYLVTNHDIRCFWLIFTLTLKNHSSHLLSPWEVFCLPSWPFWNTFRTFVFLWWLWNTQVFGVCIWACLQVLKSTLFMTEDILKGRC